MYKLLTTAAVILTVATPSIANEWTGGKQLTQDLETIYDALDGQTQFGQLQSDSTIVDTKHGQLDGFFSKVDQGVTYITLTVDENFNITPGINAGVAFSEIQTAKDDLVNRVNYDLFVNTDGDLYDNTQDYVTIKADNPLVLPGSPQETEGNDYTTSFDAGLAGVKITQLVTDVNTVNDFLIHTDTTASQNEDFVTEWGNGAGSTAGVEVADIFSDIADLNVAINTASTAGGTFFGDIDGGTFLESNVNDFVIPSYNNFESIGNESTPGGYTSISNWANGIQSVTVDAGVGTVNAVGEVIIVDAAAGTITVAGNPYTYSDGVFVAG